MNLALPSTGLDAYKSPRQRTRVATESWGATNLYCPNCTAEKLFRTRTNTPAVDFTCRQCEAPFQLKSQRTRITKRITDAAYSKMCEAIRSDKTPNLLALHYEHETWKVKNLILVPRFVFSISCIQKRKPLAAHAERHGWVGCTIMLENIPPEALIYVVREGMACPHEDVRNQFGRLRPLGTLNVEKRGWTLDILRAIRSLNKTDFTLPEVYTHADTLARLHPQNLHVRDKIRQQLQVLRDLGLLEFLGAGSYRLR